MSVQRRGKAWRVRWKEGDRWQSRTFDRKRDADALDTEIRRHRRLGTLHALDAGAEPLTEYVTTVWAPVFASQLAPKTRSIYATIYDRHIGPTLGSVPLRELNPETISRWQSDLLAVGVGHAAVRKAMALLGSILQRAAAAQRIQANPARLVRKTPMPRRSEVRPLAPVTVERMRAASEPRDATLIGVLAYSGVRPGEALALRWGDIRQRTILVERSIALGKAKPTKTGKSRTVRLVAPLAQDLREWKLASGRPGDRELIFPGVDGRPWTEEAWKSWRRRAFARALRAAGVDHARPYDLRHSYASLLLHEGRSVVDAAAQLGHSRRCVWALTRTS
jgi:integrase